MVNRPRSDTPSNNWLVALFSLFFFLGCYFLIKSVIQPDLYFQRQEPVFLFGIDFFRDYLLHPGGVTGYIGAFLSQFFYIGWAGSLIITATFLLISVSVYAVLKIYSRRGVSISHLIPVFFLILVHMDYRHPFANTLGFFFALIFTALYCYLPVQKSPYRMTLFFALSVLFYYLSAGPYLLFALLCVLYELMQGKRILALVYLPFSALLPYLAGNYIWFTDMTRGYFGNIFTDFIYTPSLAPTLLYVSVPVLVLIRAWNPVLCAKLHAKKAPESRPAIVRLAIDAAFFLLFVGFTYVSAMWSHDIKIKRMLQIENHARHGRWLELLQISMAHPSDMLAVTFQTNRAHFFTGRLADEMFAYPQRHKIDGLLLPRDYALSAPLQNSDLYLELGHVNEAQHWALESLTINGYTPWNLKRLILIHILKEEKQAAIGYLSVLKRAMFQKKWVDQLEKLLADETLILRDKNFRLMRQNMITDDFVFFFSADHTPEELKVLLERNPKNRMAFEYLMAFYLLECSVGEIVENIGRLADFNYARIPRHYEEALVFYAMITGKHDFDLGPLKVSANTLQRFHDYHAVLARYNGDRDAARPELLRKYGNTFWFYAMYVNPPDAEQEKETLNFGDNR